MGNSGSDKGEDRPFYGWGVLGVFTFGFSTLIIAMISLGLLLPEISEELSLSPSQQGWLGSSVLFGNVLFSIPINWWVSRYRPWRVATISFLAGTLFVAFGAWAPTFAVLLLARIGLGLVQQAIRAPRTLLIIQWFSRKQILAANGFSISIVDLFLGTGLILIPLLMEWVGGWRNTMYTWALVCLGATVLWMILGRDRVTPEYTEQIRFDGGSPLVILRKYREVWFIFMCVFGFMLGRMAFSVFWPTLMQDEYSIKATTIGYLVGTMSYAMAPSELFLTMAPLLVRHRTTVLVACGLAQCLSYVALIFIGSVPLLVLLAIVNGASFGFFPVLMAMIFNLPDIKPREVAIASSMMFTVMWGGGALGPILVGFVQEATGDLQLALLITSLAPISVVIGGLLLGVQQRTLALRGLEEQSPEASR